MPRLSNYGVIFIYMNIYDEAMGVFIPFGHAKQRPVEKYGNTL